MIPNSAATTVEDLVKFLTKPKTYTVERRTLASPVALKHVAERRGRMPEFAPVAYSEAAYRVVGTIGDYKILIDPLLKISRVAVSKRFREVFPELVASTQEWMNDFFGYDYPIYIEGKQVLMHPESLERLKNMLAGRP